MAQAHYARTWDSGERSASSTGVLTDRAVYLHGFCLTQATGTNLSRIRIHPGTDGSPAATDQTFATATVGGNAQSAEYTFEPPILSHNGIEWAIAPGASSSCRLVIYYSEAGQAGG